jgi:hypothetical protein
MIYGVFDLEIIKAIPPKDAADRLDGIEYCNGWTDYQGMGISVGSLSFYDSDTGEISESIALGTANQLGWVLSNLDPVIKIGGFNSKKFDDKLLQANGIDLESDFDILEMVLSAAGLAGKNYWSMTPKRSYKLADIVAANGMEKTLNGELAPIEWQQGRKDVVIEYCRNDTAIEAGVLKLLLEGELIDPNTGDKLRFSTEAV